VNKLIKTLDAVVKGEGSKWTSAKGKEADCNNADKTA